MHIKSIRREIRLLRYYALGVTLFAGVFLLGAVHEARQVTFDALTVHRIDVVDREGKIAMSIYNHDDAPPAIINGKSYKRSGGNDDNGILFYNQRGNEQGGLTWSGLKHPDGTYESGNTLSFDTVTTDQLLQVDDGNVNGKTYSYLIGWNRPRFDTPEYANVIDQLQKATTPDARRAILAQHPDIAAANVTRFLFGYDPTNTAQVMLADQKGKPRIKMFVTAAGQAQLQFLDGSGKVVAQYPQVKE